VPSIELRCTYDPATRGGDAPDGRKVKATLHWVSAAHAVDAEVRLYDRLFTRANPDEKTDGKTFKDFINPDALEVLHGGASWNPAWRRRRREISSNSNGWATFLSIQKNPPRANRCSTGPSPCATPGPS
jgi:hypothetical protein